MLYKGLEVIDNAVAGCGASLTTCITIPSTVVAIENEAFYGCTNLKEIHLCEGLQTINREFQDCSPHMHICIPSTAMDKGMPCTPHYNGGHLQDARHWRRCS